MPTGKPKSGTPRIRWTDREHELLLAASIKLLRDGLADSGTELVDKAQRSALPQERWRPRTSISSTSATSMLKAARAAVNREAQSAALSPPEQPQRRATDLNPLPPPPSPIEAFVSAVAQALAQILSHPDVVAAARSLLLPAELAPAMIGAQAHYPFGIEALKGSKKPKVLIAGVKHNQGEALKPLAKELGLNVEFWSKDESSESLRRLARNSDTSIGMVNFIAHSHDAILKSGSSRYLRVPGGVSAIAAKLRSEYPATAGANFSGGGG